MQLPAVAPDPAEESSSGLSMAYVSELASLVDSEAKAEGTDAAAAKIPQVSAASASGGGSRGASGGSATRKIAKPAARRKGSHRRDCHFTDIPSPSILKHPLKGEGGAAE